MAIDIGRRKFISALGCAATAWPIRARAQQPDRVRRIGVLMGDAETDPEGKRRIAAFRDALAAVGWSEGQNIRFEYRWAGGDAGRTRDYAKELVDMVPDLLLAQASSGLAALLNLTKTIAIVFVGAVDPVEQGFVASLAHPGGNATGFTNFEFSIAGKWLEFLKAVEPRLERVAVIGGPGTGDAGWFRKAEELAPSFEVELLAATVHDEAEIAQVIADLAGKPGGGLIDLPDVFTRNHRQTIIELSAKYRIASMYPVRVWAADGGLMSYGLDIGALYKQAAGYADRILKGEKPGDLPVQAPTKFELVINLKTAKALDLTIPPTLISLADEVIE